MDTLHAKAVQWQATLYQIELKSYPVDYIEATLLVTPKIYLDDDQKYPDLSNIVLSARVLPDNTIIKDKLKDLLKGDRVLITGSFEKNKTGDIEFTSNGDDKDYAFSNPKLDFKIESITKITKKLQ
ncbi:hypothetical protein ACRQ5D_17905 [Mucilaginibacter sp. P25]|uniref:hypothetical protein n=1 Tax=unclassified Mucilaginibacter TaxID=2617802 RepID=UPI003D66A987